MISRTIKLCADRFSDRKSGHPDRPAAQILSGTITGDSSMRHIKLTRGKFAIVDDGDYGKLNKHKWCHSNGYATRRSGGKIIFMHRVILNVAKGAETDHKNHNKSDNRRCNIRICTKSQNNQNRKRYDGSASQYKGVHWNGLLKKWRAQIVLDYKKVHIGVYCLEIDAAKAYDAKAEELFGRFAYLNFNP